MPPRSLPDETEPTARANRRRALPVGRRKVRFVAGNADGRRDPADPGQIVPIDAGDVEENSKNTNKRRRALPRRHKAQ